MPRHERPNQSHDYVVTKYLEIICTAYAPSPEDLSLNPRNEWRTFVKNRELRKEGRYFDVDDSIDSDEEEYEEYCKRYLNPKPPFVLYEDGAWKNRKIKEKYECETFRYREGIIKITKKETRERRRNIDGRRGE